MKGEPITIWLYKLCVNFGWILAGLENDRRKSLYPHAQKATSSESQKPVQRAPMPKGFFPNYLIAGWL